MSNKNGRTARHRSLARELEKLRVQAGLTPEEAARALGWSRPKLVRIENTTSMPALADVGQILGTYGGRDEGLRFAILELARHIRERGWWTPFEGVIEGSYAELEHEADRILSFQPQVIPGILQEEAYALELIRGHTKNPAEQRDRLEVRKKRQAILDREKPPILDIVITEEVLRRAVGGTDVMRGQLAALLSYMDRPDISVRVVPERSGRYPSIGQGPIVIFEFDSPIDLNTAYVETFAGGYYVEETSMVRACRSKFDEVTEAALDEEGTRALILTMI